MSPKGQCVCEVGGGQTRSKICLWAAKKTWFFLSENIFFMKPSFQVWLFDIIWWKCKSSFWKSWYLLWPSDSTKFYLFKQCSLVTLSLRLLWWSQLCWFQTEILSILPKFIVSLDLWYNNPIKCLFPLTYFIVHSLSFKRIFL